MPLMRARTLLPLTLALASTAAPAAAADRLVARGGGYGHGVGMSQYGALGFARHGAGYREILGHYYSGTQIGRLEGRSGVRVLLQGTRTPQFDGAVGVVGGRALDPATTYRVTAGAGGNVVLRSPRGRALATFAPPLRVTGPDGGGVRLLGASPNGITSGVYRGSLDFSPGPSGVLAVNNVGLEDYVRGVVAAESPASWPAEALKAQAVAARTYAVTTSKGHPAFDHYVDTRSQMYLGVAGERPTTDAAVAATRDEVVTYQGRPVVTYFFSTSGGRTEDVEHSFLGAPPQPWLRSVEDPYDSVSPRHRWSLVWTLRQAERKLGSWVKGRLQGIEVRRTGSSPRVVAADVVGTRGRTSVTGPQLRTRLGLPDHWVSFTTIRTDVRPPDASAPGAPPAPGGVAPVRSAGGATAALTGRVVPGRAGRTLRIQRRAGEDWVDTARVRTGEGGRYRAPVVEAGTYRVAVSRGVTGPAVRVG
jgi:stage II sporulation protein D